MEREQELEWKEAQSIVINVDLVSAAKRHLEFLAAVDRKRWLYEGQGLDRAIYRYNACWLPLLAKHSKSPLFEGPLVVPFDCEWVWHCHRLNPVRYKTDCREFYGRILDNEKVVSSLEGTSRNATEEIWKTLYPGEPFELDLANTLQDNTYVKKDLEKFTKYDLISAVHRQSPFFYQVSRPHMNDNRYLEGAVARYKGFLHLIKRNKEKSIPSFSVPTYDVDLIWHTHQLHPVSYCKDLLKIMGKILEHDDTDSDRTKGQKLDVGYSGTTKTFEEMYGCRYWRAGAMYRGSAPSPVRTTPFSGISAKKAGTFNENQKIILPKRKALEVMLEFVGVRNLPEDHKGSLYVSFSKAQPDEIFSAKRSLTICSESGEKQVASFQCEPNGHLVFELISLLPTTKASKTMGTTSMPLEDFLSPESNLTVEKWLELVPSSNIMGSKPIGLRVAISVTIPTPAPYVLHMTRSRMFSKNSCLFPLPVRVLAKSWTDVVDDAGNLVMSLQMRDSKKPKGKKKLAREVVCIMESGETRTLAEFAESEWSIVNSPWSLQLPNTNNDDGHILELTGPHTVRLYSGGRLDYESRRCEKHKVEHGQPDRHLITAVEFSEKEPYGKAVAVLDLKSGTVKVKEEWFLMPSFILNYIFGNISRKEGYNNLITSSKISNVEGLSTEVVSQKEVEAVKENGLITVKVGAASGGCGSGCGSGCGNAVRSVESGGGCGSGCGGGCGDMAKAGGCGSGCGGGCGDMAKSSGCGSGCGGGCGDMVKSGGCGSGCGGGCGDMVKSGGCGSGCGGGCGDMVKSGGCGSGCGGGCGDMVKSSMGKCGGCGGGCGGGGGGGCGGGCSNKQVGVPGNEIVVA
ncbi:hypothetical protein ACJIZ3_002336 [Penstemon smallii]|uniref:Glycine-rich domain-containing protein 1 n=1 Tax=Penstemon smallii TaxID=265156 RepID=A0ABD3U8X7_9LAMI